MSMVFKRWNLVHLALFSLPAWGHALPLTFFAAPNGFVAGTTLFRAGGITSFTHGQACRIDFMGSGRTAVPSGVNVLAGVVNVLGPGAQTGLPTFEAIEYRSLYPGVGLRFTANGYRLKSEYIVAPGHNPGSIRLRYADGKPEIRRDGSLFVRSGLIEVIESPPMLYQTKNGKRVPIEGGYKLHANGIAGFRVGVYDGTIPLVIDPVLTFAMSLGGSQTDVASGVSQDAAGNIYLAGWTDSADFSTAIPTLPRSRGVDAWVMKLDAVTKNLVYLTYIGGSGDDRALGIAADADGFVYICGSTTSPDFPVSNAQQPGYSAGRDGFAAKLDPTGKKLLYSTYLGGTGDDSANAIAIDGNGNAYVTGETDSNDFPTRTPFQAARSGGHDVFLASFSRTGTVQYATYLGGSGNDRGLGVAVDANGNAYITGSTESANFPVLAPLRATKAGGQQDAFVAKLNAQGTALIYSTYLGGSGGSVLFPEQGNSIAVDASGNAYIVGTTSSADFPTLNPLQGAYLGSDADAFITKLDPTGSKLVYSTYLGGTGIDVATAVRLDPSGNVFVAGYTSSPDFPNVQAVGVPGGLYDAFLVKLASTGSTLLFSTLLGGQQNDIASSLSGVNETVVAGATGSPDRFPGTLGINALVFGVQIAPSAPIGFVDTPQNNATNLSGAVGITGWAIDQDQVPTVEIWRDPVPGEPAAGNGLVYIGNGVFVPGARPDVATLFPTYPFRDRAGWGLQVLTNQLPNGSGSGPLGNGTYKFHALVHNLQGLGGEIGQKTVTVDNVHSVLPFGTFDTPGPGATVSGTAYVNFGWVLAPQPFSIPVDGSTIVAYIDGIAVGHPVYNNFRTDIATLFPGLNNSNAAVGYFIIDTTRLTNGIHAIVWGVYDNVGHAQGIGSRNFFVQN
jgi:Beta-propeller repeat